MSFDKLNYVIVLIGMVIAAGVFTTLFFVSAPYGRHARGGWGPLISNYLGWIIMETPSVLVFALCFAVGNVTRNVPVLLFFVMWELHYIHRAFIYPFTIRDGRKKIPIAVILMGFVFNLGNAYANGRFLFTLSAGYSLSWLKDPRFIIGLVLFITGFAVNRWSDLTLRSLRKPGGINYSVPYGGLYRWVSCPNYLGEIIEWMGWALATWSLPGLAFAVWTFANLAPRARSHHAWYHAQFPEYPQDRKALIPYVW